MSTDTVTAPEPDDEPPGQDAAVVDLDEHRRRAESADETDQPPGEAPSEPAPLVPVDPADLPEVDKLASMLAAKRRAILPAWARSLREARAAARVVTGHYAHVAGFHLLRAPLVYAPRLAGRAPRGFARALRSLGAWLADAEGRPARIAAVARDDAETYLKLSRQRNDRVKARMLVFLPVLTVLAAAGLYLALFASMLIQLSALAVAALVFGLLGAPQDKPLIGQAVVATKVVKLTSDIVIRALGSLGIAGINKALSGREGIAFPEPIERDGPGFRAVVDLPYGVTATDVIERRDRLASGLRRPLGCVWPEPVRSEHTGRLVLWVGDQDMSSAKQPAWPLAKSGKADVFTKFAFGTDPRGRIVHGKLMYTNWLFGAIPGMGKTFSLSVPLLYATLDPTAEIWAFELKGTGGLEPVEKICPAGRYVCGPDDEHVEATLHALRDLRKECSRRAKVIGGLPKTECPEKKVTRALANRKSLGLHPLVVGIDECQELFSHKEHGEEAGQLVEKIIKVGRALGVILLLATQRPDAKSLPTGVSANVGTRFCLKVMGQLENDMILGTSSYRNGLKATMFADDDYGIGYLVGAGAPTITRTFFIDLPDAEKICARALAMRQAAGTLGTATGQASPVRESDLLADILAVVPASVGKVWSETVTAALAEHRPEIYAGWKPEQLAAALKPYGITTGQVWDTDPATGKGANRRGIDRAEIAETVAQRNRKRAA
jgi:S-DNA-T family DNA segregation ATPase FtsK/SpoIIIE